MTTSFTALVTLHTINCGACGGIYAINERYRSDRATDGGDWTCPYCKCRWGYSDHNENSRLKKELEQKARELTAAKCETLRNQQLLEAEQQARQKSEKKLKRVGNGVCPCCKRSFTNLARHMATKHKSNTL